MEYVRSPGSSSESSCSEAKWALNVRSSPTEALNMVIDACVYLSVCAPDSLAYIALTIVEYTALKVDGRTDAMIYLSTPGDIKHDIVSGLKYLLLVVPSTDACEKMFLAEEEPSGILARGYYDTESQFVDDDCISHLEWNWSFDIRN
ncbi:hypothetical protein HPULCUR_002362 [Helicostylum pulchrum]|uniref:Uncharacterized protein n=1 Tax=Helicostylum pulchrum TaxID=562976 RepID=A0ABP9XQA8_9FUNG